MQFNDFIAFNAVLVAVTKRHVSQRPFKLEINAGYFWKPQNNSFQLVKASRVYDFITNSVQSQTIFRRNIPYHISILPYHIIPYDIILYEYPSILCRITLKLIHTPYHMIAWHWCLLCYQRP